MNWLKLQRVDVPANPISLSLARQHLRETSTEQDELIDLYIRAAADMLEGPDGAGMALNSQQWDLWLDDFYDWEIRIPIGPLIQVDAITYTDTAGAEQTLPSSEYEVDTLKGLVRPLEGGSWPATDDVYNAVKVRFTAGYASGQLPSDLQAALLLILGHLYLRREQTISGTIIAEIPMGAQTIIERYRRGRFA